MGLFQNFRKAAREKQNAPAGTPFAVASPLTGAVVPMEEIPDPAFAEGSLGPCVGIEPPAGEGEVCLLSPLAGTVTQCSDTGHAVGITSTDKKTAVLLHAGIDTVEMQGDGFTLHVREGDTVSAGTPVLTMDTEKIRAAGHPCMVIVIVTEAEIPVRCAVQELAQAGEILFAE